MKTAFHVTSRSYRAGDLIHPGNWGRQTRRFGAGLEPIPPDSGAIILLWEIALESVRRSVAERLPSRLDCVFACETEEHAALFRNQYRSGAAIVKIDYSYSTPIHIGDFGLISRVGNAGPYVDFMIEHALRYWTNTPSGLSEILIGGPVQVVD